MAGSTTAGSTASPHPFALLGNVLVALLAGVGLGVVAVAGGGVSGVAALGLVVGVTVALGGLAAVPVLLRLVW